MPGARTNYEVTGGMRLFTLKLRTLIVLVALATLAVCAVEYQRRGARYRKLAERELAKARAEPRARLLADRGYNSLEARREQQRRAVEEARHRRDTARFLLDAEQALEDEQRLLWQLRGLDSLVSRIREHNAKEQRAALERVEYHMRRRAAYLRCARWPWLSPPPDEPAPRGERAGNGRNRSPHPLNSQKNPPPVHPVAH